MLFGITLLSASPVRGIAQTLDATITPEVTAEVALVEAPETSSQESLESQPEESSDQADPSLDEDKEVEGEADTIEEPQQEGPAILSDPLIVSGASTTLNVSQGVILYRLSIENESLILTGTIDTEKILKELAKHIQAGSLFESIISLNNLDHLLSQQTMAIYINGSYDRTVNLLFAGDFSISDFGPYPSGTQVTFKLGTLFFGGPTKDSYLQFDDVTYYVGAEDYPRDPELQTILAEDVTTYNVAEDSPGELKLLSVPETISFNSVVHTFESRDVTTAQTEPFKVEVLDSTSTMNWTLSASFSQELVSTDHRIPAKLYVDGTEITTLSPLIIPSSEFNTSNSDGIAAITFSKEQLQLSFDPSKARADTTYQLNINWTLIDAP